jgi:hypothetical protein
MALKKLIEAVFAPLTEEARNDLGVQSYLDDEKSGKKLANWYLKGEPVPRPMTAELLNKTANQLDVRLQRFLAAGSEVLNSAVRSGDPEVRRGAHAAMKQLQVLQLEARRTSNDQSLSRADRYLAVKAIDRTLSRLMSQALDISGSVGSYSGFVEALQSKLFDTSIKASGITITPTPEKSDSQTRQDAEKLSQHLAVIKKYLPNEVAAAIDNPKVQFVVSDTVVPENAHAINFSYKEKQIIAVRQSQFRANDTTALYSAIANELFDVHGRLTTRSLVPLASYQCAGMVFDQVISGKLRNLQPLSYLQKLQIFGATYPTYASSGDGQVFPKVTKDMERQLDDIFRVAFDDSSVTYQKVMDDALTYIVRGKGAHEKKVK